MQILPRSAWTTTPNGWSHSLTGDAVVETAIHWPGTSVRSYAAYTREQIASVIRGFESHHINTRNWPAIGYCYLVDLQGRIWEGAGDRKAAHSATASRPNANAEILGVQLILGTEDRPTEAMVQATRWLIAEKRRKFPRMRVIIGHRDVRGASTACPGSHAYALVRSGAFEPGSSTTITTGGDDMYKDDPDLQRRFDEVVGWFTDRDDRQTAKIDQVLALVEQLHGGPAEGADGSRTVQRIEAIDVRTGPDSELRTQVRALVEGGIPDLGEYELRLVKRDGGAA